MIGGLSVQYLLFMPPGRRVDAARAVRRGTAPYALVAAGTMPVRPVRAVDATAPIGAGTAPFAMLLVVAMLMRPVWTVDASLAVA